MEKARKLDKLRGISEDLPEGEHRMLMEANNSRSTLKSSIKGETVDKDDLEILLQEVNSAGHLQKKDTNRLSL